MDYVALGYEPYIRLCVFGGVLFAMAIWELFGPRRKQAIRRSLRWPNNLGVVVVDTLFVRLVFPTTAVGLALISEAHGWGLFSAITPPLWIAVVSSVILLDLAIYFQHVLFHAVPALWRLHRMHHADLEFDVTTGLRFHPFEILVSMVIKLAVIAALGAPAVAVLIFEVLLNATSMFNHSNIRIPLGLDHVLRRFIVTPDMHRVHHSILSRETNSNFGFNLPWWDRLFGTYRAQPTAGHDGMTIGIEQFRDPGELRLDRMLLQPFRDETGRYSLGGRGRRTMSMHRFLPRLALALLLVAAAAWAAVYRDQINLATLDAWLGSLGLWAPIGYVVLYALATVAFAPGAIFALAGGALFGPIWGSLWNLLGATFGATLAFVVARYVVGDWVERKAGGLLKRFIAGVDAEGWRFVAFVQLVPLFPFNLSNYVLGLTRIPLQHYVIATLICMVPGAVAYTWLGYAGRGALTGETDAVRYGLLALGLLAATALLPRLVGRMRASFAWIEATELKRRLDGGEVVAVIDVRGPDEFTGPLGHIAGARNLPVAELDKRLAELAGLERLPLVLVCRTDRRSATAARALRRAGFTQVSVLRRGMQQWNQAGLPVKGRAAVAIA